MSLDSADRAALAAIQPLELVTFLRSTGWTAAVGVSDRWTPWVKGDCEIAVPMRNDLGDYLARVADALLVVAQSEGRSLREVLNDLSVASTDIVRFRLFHTDNADGTMPLRMGIELVRQAADILLAGACAAFEPRPYYSTRKPDRAVGVVERMRMGQTEHGSFVLTVLSRVPPALRQILFEEEPPFERKVTLTLAGALDAALRAADISANQGTMDAFQQAVPRGVSANLCEALHGLATGGGSQEARDVEVSFSWSRNHPPTTTPPSRVRFSPDRLNYIGEAGRVFRQGAPAEDMELEGPVVKLVRNPTDVIGSVTIFGLVDGKPRKVTLQLAEAEYNTAVQAHEQKRILRCYGCLDREGRQLVLRQPRGIALSDIADGDDYPSYSDTPGTRYG